MLTAQPSTVYSFGTGAQRFVSRVPAGTFLIAADNEYPEDAVAEALAIRTAGAPLAIAVICEPRLITLGRLAAAHIYENSTDPTEKRRLFSDLAARNISLEGRPLHVVAEMPTVADRVLRELLQMADVAVFRSIADRNRTETLLATSRPNTILMPYAEIAHPMTNDASGTIVVWGPQYTAQELSIYAYALELIDRTATFVCRTSLPGSTHRFIDESECARLPRRASLVIDATLADPANAIAFHDHGLRVIAARSSGAHEFIPGSATYDPLNADELSTKILQVRKGQSKNAGAALRARQRRELEEAFEHALPRPLAAGPLVSVIIPTINRPDQLYINLLHLAQQTHTNIEAVCVNDGGEPVEDIVADFAFARLINHDRNYGAQTGGTTAFNTGVANSRGTFVCYLPDDDRFFPNHIAGLIRAMERSALPVAHTNVAQRCLIEDARGDLHTFGYALHHDVSFELTELLTNGCRMSVMGFFYRREFLRELGPWNENLRVNNDYEYMLRSGALAAVAHNNNVGAIATIRADGSTLSGGNEELALRESADVFARFTPPNRPSLIRHQAGQREAQRKAIGTPAGRPFTNVWIPLRTARPVDEIEAILWRR